MRFIISLIAISALWNGCTRNSPQQRTVNTKTHDTSVSSTRPDSVKQHVPVTSNVALKLQHPFEIAGILVAHNTFTTSDVKKRFGNGYYVDDEGHGGGVYFLNAQKTVTLHYTIGVDYRIEEVTITRGVDLPDDIDPTQELPQEIYTRVNLDTLSVSNVIRLDCDTVFVKSVLGKPTKVERTGDGLIYRYQYDSPKYGYYEGTYRFIKNKLANIRIYCGC